MLDIDLDKIPKMGLLSHNRFNVFSIDDKDHIDIGESGGIKANLISWLLRQGTTVPQDAIVRLITFPRVFGYGFNPVSFYYVTSKEREPLFAVAEVTNTYREMKLYLINNKDQSVGFHKSVPKNFYVSPFSDPGDLFDFRLGLAEEEWKVNIDNSDKDGKILLSSIRGKARNLSTLRLVWYSFKYPMISVKIIALIHWHALLLWMRRIPYYSKSSRREVQLDVLRPYSSLKKTYNEFDNSRN